jgi:pilus assembly protein Flp/PilA
MMKLIKAFAKDECAATAIEYGLIASLTGIGIIAAASALGSKISGTFNNIVGNLN